MPRLIITTPEGKRNMLELSGPITSIGRSNSNDLVLNHHSVSRLHAVVKQTETGFAIADRGSTNGVVLGGQRIEGERLLQDGDTFRIGSYELKFESIEESKLVVASSPMPSTLEDVLKQRERSPSPQIAANIPKLMEQFWKLEHENYLLRLLYDAGKALHGKVTIDEIAAEVVNLAFRIHGVERGFVLLMDENGLVTRQTEVQYRRTVTGVQPQIILSRSILDRIRNVHEPILITDAGTDERFTGSESMIVSGLRSAMCAPLTGVSGALFGVLYVDNMEKAAAFTQEEMNVFAVIATQAAAAIDNALSHEQIAGQAIQQRALERFLSPEVVELIAQDPQGIRLGGVNQKVTVLFADIRGFTSLSEKMAPEEVVELLNEYFTRVTEIIFDHSGTLDKYLGDGFMAIFGAPFSKGTDAANAMRAATAIQRMVQEMNRDSEARHWPKLAVGIGVNTGIATAGNIGSPRRLDYTVIGDVVNVASRLMANAESGQVLVSQATSEEIADAFSLSPLPPLKVKGKAEALSVFALEWGTAATAGN